MPICLCTLSKYTHTNNRDESAPKTFGKKAETGGLPPISPIVRVSILLDVASGLEGLLCVLVAANLYTKDTKDTEYGSVTVSYHDTCIAMRLLTIILTHSPYSTTQSRNCAWAIEDFKCDAIRRVQSQVM